MNAFIIALMIWWIPAYIYLGYRYLTEKRSDFEKWIDPVGLGRALIWAGALFTGPFTIIYWWNKEI